MFACHDLYRTYGGPAGPHRVLNGVSLALAPGELTCLVGRSGCGKSTLLRNLAGLDAPDQGELRVDGTAVRGPSRQRVLVLQDQDQLFPWQTVVRAIGMPLWLRGIHGWQDRAMEALQGMGLDGFEHHFPWQLSGGMRQRVVMARALVAEPAVLLLDEPFVALDVVTRAGLQVMVKELCHSAAVAMLFVTHDVDEALAIADRILVMDPRGTMCLEVSPSHRQSDLRKHILTAMG